MNLKKIKRALNCPVALMIRGDTSKNYVPFFFIVFFNLLSALLEGSSFAFLLCALSTLSSADSQISLLRSIESFIAVGHLSHTSQFILFVLCAISSQVLRSLFALIAAVMTSNILIRVQETTLNEIFTRILNFSFPFVNRYKMGELAEYAKMPTLCYPALLDNGNQLVCAIAMCSVLVGILCFISVKLTLVTVLAFGLIGFCYKRVIATLSRHSTVFTEHSTNFIKDIVQSLQGIRIVHIYNRIQHTLRNVDYTLKKISKAYRSLNFINNFSGCVNEILTVIIVGIILYFGYHLFEAESRDTIPLLLTFLGVCHRLSTRLQGGFKNITTLAWSWGYLQRLNEIMRTDNKVFLDLSGIEFPGIRKEIRFNDVSLRYTDLSNLALKNFSLSISKGSTCAFVGLSGAGKSSLMDLLLRLYDPVSGKIEIDGVPLSNYKMMSWRDAIGVVNQDIFILNESIEDNIRFGKLDATPEEISEAARQAGAHLFIEELPHKYATVVGERGHRLSGGERQRIALARALVRKPSILVLDEATSNLDSHSEHLIQKVLYEMKGQKTILIVAHRLSTISHADQIAVLDHGRLIERGTHEQLIAHQGKYAHLWHLQSTKHRMDHYQELQESSPRA